MTSKSQLTTTVTYVNFPAILLGLYPDYRDIKNIILSKICKSDTWNCFRSCIGRDLPTFQKICIACMERDQDPNPLLGLQSEWCSFFKIKYKRYEMNGLKLCTTCKERVEYVDIKLKMRPKVNIPVKKIKIEE